MEENLPTGITDTTISRLERYTPDSNITVDMLERIAKGLNRPISQLVQGSLPPRSKVGQQIQSAIQNLKGHEVKKAIEQLNKLLGQLD